MKHPIKVLIVGPFPEPISGVSIANKNVKKILDKSKNFTAQIINTTFPDFDENLGKFSFKKFIYFFFINLKIYKVFNVEKVYITPGQTFFGILKYAPFIILSNLLNKELIIHVHGNFIKDQYKLLKGFKKKIYTFLISNFDKGIVLSNSLRDNLTPFLKNDNIFSIPNFAEDYLYTGQKVNVNIDEIKIIYLSNLMKEKGIIELLKALKILENEGVKFKAKIAGNIDEQTKGIVSSLLDKLNNTEYLGVVKGIEKKKLLCWGNVFVLPTYYKMEGQPISIIEAMATYNVIVTTKHAGIPDLIEDNVNGFFVEKRNVNDLKERLLFLINNKKSIKEITLINKELFLYNFTLKKFQEKLLNIFIK